MQVFNQLSPKSFVNKTWTCFSCSPLFNFNERNLLPYSHNLALFIERQTTKSNSHSEGKLDVAAFIEFEKWISSTTQTVEGLTIKINAGTKILVEVWLLDINANTSGLLSAFHGKKRPSSNSRSRHNEILIKPLMLSHGLIKYRQLLLSWLEETFDCYASLLNLNPVDLTWIISMWVSLLNRKEDKTENVWPGLTWKIPAQEDGLDSICFSLKPQSLRNIWKTSVEEDHKELLYEDVQRFINALYQFLFELFRIRFDSLPLIEVASSFAKVNARGVLKISSEANVWNVLGPLCSFAMERLHI